MDEENDPMEPMITPPDADGSGVGGGGGRPGIFARLCSIFNRSSTPKLYIEPYQELIICPKVYKRSMNCLRFVIT